MPIQDLDIQAIGEALKANWPKAIELNLKLLAESPDNVPALNRLAKSYLETGEIVKSIKILKKALKIDKYNPITKKNLLRAEQLSSKSKKAGGTRKYPSNSSCLFLEEPGKTKILRLLNLAPKSVLLSINPLDEVLLAPKRHTIQVTTVEGKYIGALPDDIAKRLTALIKGGNKYEAFIKSAEKKVIDVFIKETHKCNKYSNQPSFLSHLKESSVNELRQEEENSENDEKKKEEEEDANY